MANIDGTLIGEFVITDDLVDRLAKAAYENAARNNTARRTVTPITPWAEATPLFRVTFRRQIRAALTALHEYQESLLREVL